MVHVILLLVVVFFFYNVIMLTFGERTTKLSVIFFVIAGVYILTVSALRFGRFLASVPSNNLPYDCRKLFTLCIQYKVMYQLRTWQNIPREFMISTWGRSQIDDELVKFVPVYKYLFLLGPFVVLVSVPIRSHYESCQQVSSNLYPSFAKTLKCQPTV